MKTRFKIALIMKCLRIDNFFLIYFFPTSSFVVFISANEILSHLHFCLSWYVKWLTKYRSSREHLSAQTSVCSDVVLIIFQKLSESKLMQGRNIFGFVLILSHIFQCFSLIVIDRNILNFFSKLSQ